MLSPYLFRADIICLSAPSRRHLGSAAMQVSCRGHRDFLSLAWTASFYCSRSLLEYRAKNQKKRQLSVMSQALPLFFCKGVAQLVWPGGMCMWVYTCVHTLHRWVCAYMHKRACAHVRWWERTCIRRARALTLCMCEGPEADAPKLQQQTDGVGLGVWWTRLPLRRASAGSRPWEICGRSLRRRLWLRLLCLFFCATRSKVN